jgi:hypothetical protein
VFIVNHTLEFQDTLKIEVILSQLSAPPKIDCAVLNFLSTEQYVQLTSTFVVGFEVFTAVVMKSIIFWDMTPCSPLCSNRRFGGASSG